MMRHVHRQRLASLESMMAPAEPVRGGPTVGDALDALTDPHERQRLAAAISELVALDARRATLTDAERCRAADLARAVDVGLLNAPNPERRGP